jgi:hypothetical protein
MKILSVTFNRIFVLILLVSAVLAYPRPARAALGISGVTPSTVSNAQAALLTVTGADFQSGAVVSLDGYGALTTYYFSSTTLNADLPAGIPIGVYSVTVTNPDSSTATLPNALTVVAATPTPTSSPTPVYGYERPVIVVYSYGASESSPSLGASFTMHIKLYNAGQKYATNVVATFTTGDLIPRDTGGVVAVGDIAPDNRADLSQPFTVSYDAWGKAIVSVDMLVTYTDSNGAPYSEKFTLTISIDQPIVAYYTPTPTPTTTPTPTAAPVLRPQLVITSYSTSVTPTQPGTQFSLQLSIQNMGNAAARRVTMIAGGGSSTSSSGGGTQEPGGISGAGGEFTNFAPLGSSNVQSLGDLTPGSLLDASQSLIVNVNTNPGAYPMKISFTYTDENNNTYTDDQVITLLVYSLPSLDINFYRDPGPLFAGQPNLLPIQVVNLGRKSIVLGNMRVEATGAQFSNNVILVGNLDMGGYFTLDATIIPDLAGPLELVVTIDYTDDFNQSQTIQKTIPVEVLEMAFPSPDEGGMDNGGVEPSAPTEPETFWQKVWRFILGLLGLDSAPAAPETPGEIPPAEQIPSDGETIPVPPLKGP